MSELKKISSGAVQNTGNPVFDATVNILMNTHVYYSVDAVALLHKALLEIYEQEPIKPSQPRLSMQEMAERAKR